MECGICLDDKIKKSDIHSLECKHVLCKTCYHKLLKPTCPFCRKTIRLSTKHTSYDDVNILEHISSHNSYYSYSITNSASQYLDFDDIHSVDFEDVFQVRRCRSDRTKLRRDKLNKRKEKINKVLLQSQIKSYKKSLVPNSKKRINRKINRINYIHSV